jgi:Zn-dependent protease with chaperone function/pimeloyl-ACP methyl ester carboxylesterase
MRFSGSLTFLLTMALGLCSIALADGSSAPDPEADTGSRVTYTPAERLLIDEGALWSPREPRIAVRAEAYTSSLKWIAARTPLPIAEEIQRAAGRDEQLRAKHKVSEPPEAAVKVFQTLVEALPARMRPPEIEFTLSAVDTAEPDSFTLGAGRVYLRDAFFAATLEKNVAGPDRLAFVLAHALGHLALGHARRVYQRLWMIEHVYDNRSETTRAALEEAGWRLESLYLRDDEFQADLFAVQLCRNAGFDVENCLDVLRRQALTEDAALIEKRPPREGTPPVEPEFRQHDPRESELPSNHPTARQRLRRLRLEMDGLIYGERFGIFEFDRATGNLVRAADGCFPAEGRVVVCIHGMESSLRVYLPLMKRLAAEPSAAEFRIFGFLYPNDESLARSGKYLGRELKRVCAAPKNIDFVCHSAGGLVFRHYAEIEGGEFRRVYFQGTPHLGSDLSRLRSLLEALQFMRDLKLGYDGALQQAILDGRGQMSLDLQPGSLFLTRLNAPRVNPGRERCTIYRGQALTPARTALLKTAVDAARVSLARKIKNDDAKLAVFSRAALEKFVLPAEIVNGDLAVTLESAALEGVEAVHTYPLRHTELPRDPSVMDHLVKQLVSEP